MREKRYLSLVETHQALQKKEVSSVELVNEHLKVLEEQEGRLHAFLEILRDEALMAAAAADKALARGEDGKLLGMPIAIKDNICTTVGHTTAASKILENFKAPYDSTVVKKILKAGAIILGKTNLDEFAMGSSTEYSAFGPTRNPWDTSRIPGGSSGGSAAAVASGEVLAALGTDTGGSIRHPASMCGVVGLKPTYGRVSRFGVIAYGSSLDQVGPLTRTVKDAALMLQILAGRDERDATTSPQTVTDYAAACDQDVKGIKIGIPKEFFGEQVSAGVKGAIEKAISVLQEMGAVIKEISLPLTPAGIAVYYIIAKAEASTNLARYDALRYSPMDLSADDLIGRYMEARGKGFGSEVKRAILMGTYTLSAGYYDAWYKQASKVRTLIRREYENALSEVDVIACPVSPEVAWPLNTKIEDPLAMYLADALTVPVNVAGLPALSVPCGFSDNMPVGMQIIAPHFQEERLFTVGHAYEQSQNWWQQYPPLTAN